MPVVLYCLKHHGMVLHCGVLLSLCIQPESAGDVTGMVQLSAYSVVYNTLR